METMINVWWVAQYPLSFKKRVSGKYSDLVLNAISNDALSVQQLKSITGLTNKQIRGVLNAPRFNITKFRENGVMYYLLGR